MSGIRAWILAKRPNDELFCLRRTIKDVRVVTVQTSLRLHDANSASRHRDLLIMAFLGARKLPLPNQSAMLEVIENLSHERSFFHHRGSLRTSNLLDGAAENARIPEFLAAQTVCTNTGSCLSQGLNVSINSGLSFGEEFARNDWTARGQLKLPSTFVG